MSRPQVIEVPKTKGFTEKHAVLCGDAYDLIAELPKESIDTFLTSPPYWGLRTYGLKHNWDIWNNWISSGGKEDKLPGYEWYRGHGGVLGLEPVPEWYVGHLVEAFDRALQALRPGGSLWVNLGDTYFARWASIRDDGRQGMAGDSRTRRRTPMGGYRQEKQLLQIPGRFAIAMQNKRWILRNDVIWFKPNIPPRPEEDRLRLAHEHFYHFVKKPKEGRAKYYYDISAVEEARVDVVTVNVKAGKDGHTATFPDDLIRPRILSSCPPKGRLCDPYCGIGSSLRVAAQEGRQVIGFDISKEYVQIARRELSTV